MKIQTSLLGQRKLMRVRPGIMANFSGGYGYMPFVVLVSVPLGLVTSLMTNCIVYFTARSMRLETPGERNTNFSERVNISRYLKYVLLYLGFSLLFYFVAGSYLTQIAVRLLYEESLHWVFWAIVLSTAPLILAFFSTVLLSILIWIRGVRWAFLVTSILFYILPFISLVALWAFVLYGFF